MSTTTQKQSSLVPKAQASIRKAPSIKHQPRGKRYFFDVGLGSVCLSGTDTGNAYCLLEVSLAPGMAVPRHTHTREDEVYFVLGGELQASRRRDFCSSARRYAVGAPRHPARAT